jgi:hypothetical protein
VRSVGTGIYGSPRWASLAVDARTCMSASVVDVVVEAHCGGFDGLKGGEGR